MQDAGMHPPRHVAAVTVTLQGQPHCNAGTSPYPSRLLLAVSAEACLLLDNLVGKVKED